MAPFTSYRKMLIDHISEHDPQLILEWGPGESTGLMLRYGTGLIDSVEHDKRWYDQAVNQYGEEKRLTLHYVPYLTVYPIIPHNYHRKYNFVFVDGLCDLRVACLKAAHEFLAAGGYVMLHDSERSKYNPGRVGYETVLERDGTALMREKQ